MSICLIDTTIFCEILNVPDCTANRNEVMRHLQRHLENGTTLLLPLAVIFETGAHIAQNGDGRLRRDTAERFVEYVREALQGGAPWKPTPFPQNDEILIWINNFPDVAMTELSFADQSIIEEFHRQCRLNQGRRVFIWSHDHHLSAYDCRPTI